MSISRDPLAQNTSRIQRRIEFDNTSQELTGPIVDWLKSLSCSQVKEIRLHKSSKNPSTFFVAVVLEDGSTYCIQRMKQDFHDASEFAASRDTIGRISPRDSASPCLITVTFTTNYYPNLLTIFTVCHGIQCISSKLKRLVFANDEFFAYALLSNVVRHSLRPQHMSNNVETELEALWRDVYLFVHCREYGFRERTIAGQTHAIVQALLRSATRDKAFNLLHSTSNWDQDKDIGSILSQVSSATAWVEVSASRHDTLQHSQWDRAWNQRWDTAWGDRWNEQWSNVTKHETSSIGLKAFGNFGITLTKPIVEGRASGRAAGRAPVQVQARTIAGTPFNSDFVGFQTVNPLSSMPGNSSGLSNTETRAGPARNGNVPQIEVIAPEFTRRLPAPQRLPSSFKSYGLVPYPENCPVWATTFELAAEIGWAAAWELSLSQGKDAVHALSHPKEPNGSRVPVKRPTSQPGSALQRTTSKLVRQLSGALSPNHLVPSLAKSKRRTRLSELLSSNNSTPESIEKVALSSSPISEQPTRQHQSLELQSSPDAHHLKTASQKGTNRSQQNVARIREVLLPESSPSHHRALREARAAKSRHRREQDRIRREALELAKSKVTDGYCDPEDLMDRAAEAWKYAESMTNSPERNLSELAEEEWLEATRRSGTIIPPIMGEDQKQQAMHAWKDTFQRTWKEAWLDSWQAAWKSTWEYGWKEAVAKGIESGVDDALKNTTAEENKSLFDLDSYQRVKSVMHAETTYLGSLSRMHAMCKELEQLHTTLQHSIPISHEHIMEIRVNQSKKQWTKLIENLTEGGDQPTPGPRIVSHFEFQEIIEQQSRHRFQRDLPHTAFIQGMAEVWECTFIQSQLEQTNKGGGRD